MLAHRFLGALALATSFGVPALAQAPQGQTTIPQIVTNATGEAKYVPDRAVLQISVQTRAATAAAAGAENSQIQQRVTDTLRAMGYSADQIATTNYSVRPEYDNPKPGEEQRVSGYVVTNTVRVDIHEVDKVGKTIDAVLAKGANMIAGLDFYSSNADATRRTALTDAIARARGDAEAMARAAGGSLGELIELSSSEQPQFPRPVYSAMAMQRDAGMAETSVSPGEETVRVNVSARWRFLPGR